MIKIWLKIWLKDQVLSKIAQLSKKIDEVIVCTDHRKIVEVVKKHGGKAMLTSKKHVNGTERIFEIAKKFKKAKLIVDIQGDQPLIDPKSIDATVDFHKKNKNFDIVLPSMPTTNDVSNKNIVKTIFAKNGKILYFSRAKTPFNYKNGKVDYFKNLSIISFKPDALKKFYYAKMGKIESIEGIELMRAIEIGLNLGTFVVKGSDFAVDINEDLMRAIDIMPTDKVRKLY